MRSPERKIQRLKRYHSFSLPHYGRGGNVSFFDVLGVKHVVEEKKFKDITTDGGRFVQFYTYEVCGDGSCLKGGDFYDQR